MRVPFSLGTVGHFGLAVRDPKKSARWFERAFGFKKQFDFENGIAVGNDYVTIASSKANRAADSRPHVVSFSRHGDPAKALEHLKSIEADLEDPGDEIGPEAPGSPHMGLWVYDPDGYRWELSVQDHRQ